MNTKKLVPDRLQVHSFAVGHGDCTMLEFFKEDMVAFRLLCDGGATLPKPLVDYLKAHPRAEGSVDIDLVILSHVDGDHQGGLHRLADQTPLTIGEYWGPCLPAFTRHKWLFSETVASAVTRATDLEEKLKARNVPIIYPLEGHTASPVPGRVSISVLSPPGRLLRRLIYGSSSAVLDLLTAAPMPMEWLIAGTPYDEVEGNGLSAESVFGARTFLRPVDLDDPSPTVRLSKDEVHNAAKDQLGADWEPEFFGNRVLNDTSLVISVDVLLDGKYRRRVLLTGDQENWAYIASRHPGGLVADVLKAPHHGGQLYMADRSESTEYALDQTYLWLRARTVLVSASGHHGLPHVRFRDAVRASGATLICPNTRSFEPLSPGAMAATEKCCHKAFKCGKEQRAHTVLTLTGESEYASAQACSQGVLHRGTAPIVVMQQRLVDPDETFIRWTNTEIEKQAEWIKRILAERHKAFKETISESATPITDGMRQSCVTWTEFEALAKADGRHRLLADPGGVLKYGVARHMFWTASRPRNGSEPAMYRVSPDAEMKAVERWFTSMPHIILYIHKPDWDAINGGNRLKLLQAADTTSLVALLAEKLHIPIEMAEKEYLPRLLVRASKKLSARICDINRPYIYPNTQTSSSVLLHLHQGNQQIGDITSDEWNERVWRKFRVDEDVLKFMLEQASTSIFAPSILVNMQSDFPQISNMLFTGFSTYNRDQVPAWDVENFPEEFHKARWRNL